MKTYKDVLLCITFLTLAYYISSVILYFTDVDYNSAMIFFVAVVAISRYTEGYWYGITSSLISTFAINYFFMYPYWRFNMSISGYPVAMLCLLVSSLVVSALTSRMKEQTERNAKLYGCMDKLRSSQKEALYLVYIEEMSYSEAASVLDKTLKQIDRLLQSGKKNIRSLLEKEGISSAFNQ